MVSPYSYISSLKVETSIGLVILYLNGNFSKELDMKYVEKEIDRWVDG